MPASSAAQIPEHLPGEPPPPASGALPWLREGVTRLVLLLLLGAIALPLIPPYIASRLYYGRPPVVAPAGRFLHILRVLATDAELARSRSLLVRLLFALLVLQRWLLVPLWGLAWHLDELLYGRALDRVVVTQPIFEISAARSGSTHLAHYLEGDPHLCAPGALQTLFPFVWAWRKPHAPPVILDSRAKGAPP